MNTWGNALRLSIFGESHGEAIGMLVDGIPPGEAVDLEAVAVEMARRAPGKQTVSTARKEPDQVKILSGMRDGVTTGFPISGMIVNTNTRSGDYDSKLRPGHADMTAQIKYGGYADMRGGGHFSGRLTAPLVFAGALAKQVLSRRGIAVHARIVEIAGIPDTHPPSSRTAYAALAAKPFAVGDDAAARQMEAAILAAKADADSVGGVIECVAFDVPPGLGDPFFRPAESVIAGMLYAVPAVKGVEFGDGFALASQRGSETNDPIALQEGKLMTLSNHNGGILGGITNGMPLVVRTAVKPTPSIAQEQRTVDAQTMRETMISIHGRHDPCIVQRAVPVIEAAVAVCILDMLLSGGS